MTSTPFNVGLGDSKRSSSRVLRPPGGGHTDIFGGEPEPVTRGRRLAPSAIAAMTQEREANGMDHPKENREQTSEAPLAPIQETKAEPIQKVDTVKTAAPAAAEPAGNEAAKRVRVPPGGFSSRLW